jgi:hypothetical protein
VYTDRQRRPVVGLRAEWMVMLVARSSVTESVSPPVARSVEMRAGPAAVGGALEEGVEEELLGLG